MSEGSFWPKTWREAIPLLIWGVLIFAAGFEGVANLVHGQWVSSGISFTIMVGLTAMLLHWERLLAINPNWLVGAVMLVLLGVILSPVPDRWPFVGQWFGVGGIVVLAATAVLAIFYYLRRKRIISGDRFQATGTIEDPLALHTCRIVVTVDALSNDLYLDMAVSAYNGESVGLTVGSITGKIKYDNMAKEFPDGPVIVGGSSIPPKSEGVLTLRQWMPRNFADEITRALENGDTIIFGLQALVIAVSRNDRPAITYRLPIWDGIRLVRSVAVGKVVHLGANIQIATRITVG